MPPDNGDRKLVQSIGNCKIIITTQPKITKSPVYNASPGQVKPSMACVHPNTVSNILYVSTCYTLNTYKHTLYNNH